MIKNAYMQTFLMFAMTLLIPSSFAQQVGAISFSGSGFYTIMAGKMLGGSHSNVQDYNCPCYISDYAQASVYTGTSRLQWKPDSKVGAQGSATYNDFSITAQAVVRGATGAANLEWLYGNYNLNNQISVQLGRKRLPMFYYSDVQDIGISLPWTHLPPSLYGWEAVNYNGINLRYQDRWSDWSATANLLAGDESINNSGYWKIYNGRQSQSSVKWSNIIGGDLTLSRDWLETRAVYIQSRTEENYGGLLWDSNPASPTYQTYVPQTGSIYPPSKQQIMGVSFNVDYQNWLLRSEFIQINHVGLTWRDHAQIIGVGYHYGKWQPMATWSEYWSTIITDGVIQPATPSYPILQPLISLTLKYDLTPTSDLKIQFDSLTDKSSPLNIPNYGNSRLLTLSFDSVF